MVHHRTTNVSDRSSNPTLGDLFLKLRSCTFTGTLHWTGNLRLITGVDSNSKLVTFSLMANRFYLLFWNCKCTERTSSIRFEN